MNLDLFPGALEEIERRISELRPHAIVMALGPSSYFMPRVRPELLAGVRIWGMNDSFRIMPTPDLVVMDPPVKMLHPLTVRGKHVVDSRPERLWLFAKNAPPWREHLNPEVWANHREFDLTQYRYHTVKAKGLPPPRITDDPPAHTIQSPTGITCLAWKHGARRIGVIGCDLLPGHHVLSPSAPIIGWFFKHICAQAALLNGRIANLSPISQVHFKEPCSLPAAS